MTIRFLSVTAKYNKLCMHVCTRHCGHMCDNMLENAAGKHTGKEMPLFCADSAEVVSSSDYYA